MPRVRIHLGDDVRELDWPIGRRVHLAVEEAPRDAIVTGYLVDCGTILYRVAWGDGTESSHYAAELAAREFEGPG